MVYLLEPHIVERLKDEILAARSMVALTGAGISAESGVPTFRGKDGLWNNFDATQLATPQAFARDPRLVWEWYSWRRGLISQAEPNAGHHALVKIERLSEDFTLITQNVDGLHQRAGSKNIIELHGNIWRARCTAGCGTSLLEKLTELPPRCRCGAMLRPDVVWFGEPLPSLELSRALDAAKRSEVFMVLGTSAAVYPASELPLIAKESGAFVIEINTEETVVSGISDISIRGKTGDYLPEIASILASNGAHTKSL